MILNTPVFQLMKSLKIEIVRTVRKDDIPKSVPPAGSLPASVETPQAPRSPLNPSAAPRDNSSPHSPPVLPGVD